MVSLEELLDPKRAEREEGWQGFAKAYQESLVALQASIDKLSGKRKLAEGESVFTVLEQFAKEQAAKADLDREKAQRLHDIVSASIPAVTEEQKAAYQAQKALYEQYQKDLKEQTKAVTEAAKAQTAAIEKSASEQSTAVRKQAELLKSSSKDSVINKHVQDFADFGIETSKINGKSTPMTQLLSMWKGRLGEQQAAREEEVDQAAAAELDAIEAEKNARIAAVEEEKEARIAAIEEEIKAQAKLAGVEKAPEDPEQARAQLVAQAEQTVEAADRKGALINNSAAAEPVVAKQQEELRKEIALEAQEEKIRQEGGEFLSPAVEEDLLPGQATKSPIAEVESSKKESEAQQVEVKLPEAKESPKPKVAEAPKAAPPAKPPVATPAPASAAATAAKGASGAARVATVGTAAAGGAKVAAAAGGSAAGGAALAGMAKSLGTLASAGLKCAGWIGLLVELIKGIEQAIPIATSSIAAISDLTRVLGPMLLSVGMEMTGYIMEFGAKLVEGLERLDPLHNTRQQVLERSGVLDQARVARDQSDAQRQLARGQAGDITGKSYGGVAGAPSRLETTYTDPATAARLSLPQPVSESPAAGSVNEGAIAKQLEKLVSAQQAQGVGSVPLQISLPQLLY